MKSLPTAVWAWTVGEGQVQGGGGQRGKNCDNCNRKNKNKKVKKETAKDTKGSESCIVLAGIIEYK